MKTSIFASKRIHCIGIGGSGLSALSHVLKKTGAKVSGSDIQDSKTLHKLIASGISCVVGHSASNIKAKFDLVIYSPAIEKNNPELFAAQKHGIKSITYPEALGILSKEYRTIAICGTHGKTTTTALCAAAFIESKKDPTVIVGSSVKELDGNNFRFGHGQYLIIEACEHFRSFISYQPSIVIITNVEADHLDFYKNLKNYKQAFIDFINKIPKNGLLIANGDDKNIRDILKKADKKNTVLFGTTKICGYKIKKYSVHNNKKIASLDLKIPGKHNLMNSTAVIALANELKIDLKPVLKAINNYQGSARRFELKGIVNGTHIIDDYAHHPTEIRATLKAAREKYGEKSKILAVFQPHQYSRTRLLLSDFTKSFTDADAVIIPNILRVRDKNSDVKSITAQDLVKGISKFHKNVLYGKGLLQTGKTLKKQMKDYDVIMTMGAGDVWKISNYLTS